VFSSWGINHFNVILVKSQRWVMKLVVIENVQNPLKIGDADGMVIWYNLVESTRA
jgi:hypothetical protein